MESRCGEKEREERWRREVKWGVDGCGHEVVVCECEMGRGVREEGVM